MTDEPDIIKRLKEDEKLGRFQRNVLNTYEKLDVVENPSEDVTDKTINVNEEYIEGGEMGSDINNYDADKGDPQNIRDKYRIIAEKTSDLIALTTFKLNTTFIYVNPSYKKVLGYEPEDLIGKPCFDLIHPDDKKKMFPLLKKYIRAKAKRILTKRELEDSAILEYRIRDKSGNWHYLESTANFMGNDLLFISKDVTERKQAEEKIRASEKRYRHLLENITDSVFAFDYDWRVILVNDKGAHITQMPKEKLLGGIYFELFPGVEKTKFFKVYERVMKTRKPEVINGEWRKGWYKSHAYPVPEGIIIITTDITERKRAEEEREKLLHDLGERYKELSSLYGLSKLVEKKGLLLRRFTRDSQTLFPLPGNTPNSHA